MIRFIYMETNMKISSAFELKCVGRETLLIIYKSISGYVLVWDHVLWNKVFHL